jgi:hypothetical protein
MEPIYLKGKCTWNMLQQPDTKYGEARWRIVLYPDKDSLEIVHKLLDQGLMNELKKDDDGYFMNFARPVSKNFGYGKSELLTPVIVLDKDNSPFYGAIGHGSDVTIKLDVYKFAPRGQKDAPKKVAVRLNTVRVDNLVPFEPKRDYTMEQQMQMKGIDKQSPPQAYPF